MPPRPVPNESRANDLLALATMRRPRFRAVEATKATQKLLLGVACTGCACAYRIRVAAGLRRHNRHRPVCAAHNRSSRVKRRRGAEVQDESGIFRGAFERNSGTRLHTEWSIRFRAGNIRRG